MIIQLEEKISAENKKSVLQKLDELKIKHTEVNTQVSDYIVALPKKEVDIREIGYIPGIRDVHQVSDNYKLVSRKWKVDPTSIELEGITIKEGDLALMAGPCSIESEEKVVVCGGMKCPDSSNTNCGLINTAMR